MNSNNLIRFKKMIVTDRARFHTGDPEVDDGLRPENDPGVDLKALFGRVSVKRPGSLTILLMLLKLATTFESNLVVPL